jgi:hypothetical protein
MSCDIVLTDPKVQQQIVVALHDADKDLNDGMSGLPTWKLLESIAAALPPEDRTAARAAILAAETSLDVALAYFQKEQTDSRFRLKAAGAHWHDENVIGSVEDCPLCSLSLRDHASLQSELEALRSASEAATRSLRDNVNSVVTTLEQAVPQSLRRFLNDEVTRHPRADAERDYRRTFVDAERYAKYLTGCKALALLGLANMPADEFEEAVPRIAPSPAATPITERQDKIERLCRLADWHDAHKPRWLNWWTKLTANAKDKETAKVFRHI